MQRGHLMNHGRVECLWQLWKRWIDEVERRGGRRENNQFQGGRSPGQPAEHNWGGVLLPRPFPIPTLCPPRFDPWFQNTRLYPYFGIPNIRPILLLAHAFFSNAADGLSEKSNHRPRRPTSPYQLSAFGVIIFISTCSKPRKIIQILWSLLLGPSTIRPILWHPNQVHVDWK